MFIFNHQQYRVTMLKYLFWLSLILLLADCKSKKTSLQDEDEIEVSDFIDFFPDIKLPFQVADTTLVKKSSDSLVIGYKIFTTFIPDSILSKDFGKGAKPKIYALGKTAEKGKEKYLFAKVISGSKRVGYLFTFTKDDKFLRSMPLVKTGTDNYSSAYGMLDNKFQITTYVEKKGSHGEVVFKRNVYFYNSATDDFTLIMTEPNEEIIHDVINPIDTLPRKNKYAGDYVKNKRNFVSVRDGKNNSEILFFIHFEKDEGQCKGELKGRARFISKELAQYNETGNPCTIQLAFTGSLVSVKETDGCGSYRDIKCFFEGSYTKRKKK
jgi:hypothetical protein